MPTIITATNFSDIANKAVNYACQLALQHHSSVIVFHSYFVPVTNSYADTTMPIPVIPIEEATAIAEENMAAFMQKVKEQYPTLDLTSKILYGDIVDGLQEYTEEKIKPWLIVLGNSGDADWMGGTLLSALRTLPYPTLAIPADTVYKPAHTLCFACDYKQNNQTALQQLLSIQQQLNATLHILNINHQQDGANQPAGRIKETQDLLAIATPQYHFIDNENTDDAIQAFVTTHDIDWLVVIPHKHSFFQGLFHKSHTKAMVQHTHIPLLALHETE